MLQVLISWIWVGASSVLWGYTILALIEKISGYSKKSIDVIVAYGLCFLTVFAQLFSLFYKVGYLASIVVFIINICVLIAFGKKIFKLISDLFSEKYTIYKIIVLCLIGGMMLILSSTNVAHYDTGLYHAQSIRWIEEYGVVPGLGNLHNRLAYNSSVFSLQALFSLRFLMDRSLHSINGFVCLWLLGYICCSFKMINKRKVYISDFIRFASIILICSGENFYLISSPGSDILALALVIYILVKWIDCWEEKENTTAAYALLCVLGVYAMTVKLSSAMIILLTIYPIIKLITKKKYKEMSFFLGMGLIVLVPFLIRNVIISGYLIYPYPELDIFNVDWKMPSYTLLFDRNEIKAWGWGLKDVYRFDAPITEWFPVWINTLKKWMQIVFYANIVFIVISLVRSIYKIIKEKDGNYFVIIATIIACLLLWFMGSPLPRYGAVYLAMLPLFVIGDCVAGISINKKLYPFVVATIACGVCISMIPILKYIKSTEVKELKCFDYYSFEVAELIYEDIIFYRPLQGDQVGYYAFPSTPYTARYELIELRGEDLKDGFRMKSHYREAYVTTYGEVHSVNMFE